MKIDIWSDIACPYCYIGLTKLEKALDKLGHKDEVNIQWHSYELNSKLPMQASSQPYVEYMAEMKECSQEQVKEDWKELISAGKELGIKFNFEKLIVANTSKALRLVKLAGKKGLATKAEKALFKAYFTDGKDISADDTLMGVAKELGLNDDKVKEMLTSNKFAADVINDTTYANDTLDIEFIPYFVYNNKNKIQGAIDGAEFYNLLEKSFEDWQTNGEGSGDGESISGQSCTIDGVCS